MARPRIYNIPDLTQYQNYHSYMAIPSNPRISPSTYQQTRKKQILNSINITTAHNNNPTNQTDLRSINIDQNQNNSPNQKTVEILSEKDIINPEVRKDLIEKSIKSLKIHAPTQWQCAMTTLERLLPAYFAKRDPAASIAQAIGIRITIGEREQNQLPHLNGSAQIVDTQLPIVNIPAQQCNNVTTCQPESSN